MARTNPHHDWDDPAPRRSGKQHGTPSEWDNLRNELVALLDQVEDRLLGEPAAPPAPKPEPDPAPRTGSGRQSEALLSVKQAVERLADRSDTSEPAMRRESVSRAIAQIRARQGATANPPKNPDIEPPIAPAPSAEIAGLAQTLEQMSARIERFEAAVAARLDTLDEHGDISGQIGQLSEVIELLASAVGETGQVKRLENQIEHLAQTVLSEGTREEDVTAARVDELAETIEKLVNHQIQSADREHALAREADDRQAGAIQQIDHSVRSIYDRLDALETAGTAPSPEIEKISHEIAGLTAALKERDDPGLVIAKIDALSDRIATIEAMATKEPASLADSIATLRSAVEDAIEPRFSTLETRIDDLGARLDAANARPEVDLGGVETQLRGLVLRMDETGQQVRELATLYEQAPAPNAPVDLDALATLIAQRTERTGGNPDDVIAKTDLDALEERLSALLSTETASAKPAEQLVGVKNSITQVDSRLARLESMLNDAPSTPAAASPEIAPGEDGAAPQPAAARRKPRPDTMPADPATGTPGAETVPETGKAEDKSEPGFKIDPETIERPSKPQSSFEKSQEPDLAPEPEPTFESEPERPGPAINRASFIEAARRSARQHGPEDDQAHKSLIARAMSRFHNSQDDAAEAPQEPEPRARDDAGDAHIEPLAAPADEDQGAEKKAGFIARNKRPLLLGTALLVVLALGAQLMINRISAPAPESALETTAVEAPENAAQGDAEPAGEAETSSQPADPEPTTDPAGTDDADLMSGVRMIEQQTRLASGALDRATVLEGSTIDPIQTASIATQPDRYIARSASEPAAPVSASLPPITVPEGIEPAALREAAESGDMFAQFEVGAILTEGHVVEQDLEQAAAWYERAGAQGFAPAQYRLGSLFEGGRGVERDLDMARLWYQRAAESGNRMSMHNLASLHASGELDEQDFAAAAHWFEQAAARGLTDSQFNLGMLHARGLGVEQDFEQSYIWFSLAAQSGDEDAVAAREDVVRSLDAEAVQRLNDTIEVWAPAEIDLASNFAPIGTWDSAFDPGDAITNGEVIERVQMLLGKLGFSVGQPDGIMGPRTREAITAFERETGMNESGEVNPRLLAVLGSQPV